jgi:hypothetical protein
MMQKCKRRDLKILLTWEEATLHGWMLDLQVMTSLQKTSKQLASSVHNFIYIYIEDVSSEKEVSYVRARG